MIYDFLGKKPVFNGTNFIAPSAVLIGDVTLGAWSSVWFNCTVRGDVNRIIIGEASNIQDNTCIHVMNRTGPTIIGNQVTIGHNCMIHGCTLHDRVLIGIGSVVLDKAVIHPDVIVGAGSVVAPGKVLESGFLYVGQPARAIRELSAEEYAMILQTSENYVKYSRIYLGLDKPETNPFYE